LDTLLHFIALILHIDKFLGDFVHQYGAWVYAVLFAIVFCETGLVILPFLPGDSLLFIGGAFCATGQMSLPSLIALLLVAAVGGNTVNYIVGRAIGPKVFNTHVPFLERFLDRAALQKTHNFYERHGGKTIVLARFVPIIRTFAPVVAGVGQMEYRRFLFYNVFGGMGWVVSLTWAGYWLGHTIPDIDRHIHLIVGIVIVLSVVPIGIEWWRARVRARREPVPADP
jgi:membrane-associated protein